MSDFLIDEVRIHYHASKNREYRSRVLARFSTFVGFLQAHRLTVRQLLGPNEPPPTTLKIMRSDLTDEGFRLVKVAYDKWLKAMNSGQSATDTTLLDEALNMIRAESQG